MDKKKHNFYLGVSILLVAAIIGMIIFVIMPKYLKDDPKNPLDEIDFSNSVWIEQYVDQRVGIFEKDFYQSTAFSYTPKSEKMVVTYVSRISVDEARDYYISLPGAKQSGRNDETSLNITAEIEDQTLEVYNFFSQIARVFELKLYLNQTNAEKVVRQLDEEFPVEELNKIPEIKDILSCERYGGYVRYQYDDLDEFIYSGIPVFSRAFIFNGIDEDFQRTIQALNEAYPLNKYNDTQKIYYYDIGDHIISLSNFVTDSNEKIVSVGIQKKKSNK